MNTQIVLCKGVNDGQRLKNTIDRMHRLYPQVQSCSIVPLGMTRYRDGLPQLESFSAEDCRRLIKQVDRWTRDFEARHGQRIVYLADELNSAGRLLRGFCPAGKRGRNGA